MEAKELAAKLLENAVMRYDHLRRVDVGEHIEKKNNLSYLSWAWAVDYLLKHDPNAVWFYRNSDNGEPFIRIPANLEEGTYTAMVFCTVRAFGVERTAQLPVMDHRNRPIVCPDAFAVNTAMQRCLAKAIALHGIGLYIYAGEDLPLDTKKEDLITSDEVGIVSSLAEQAGIAATDVANSYGAMELEFIERKYLQEIVERLQKRIATKGE